MSGSHLGESAALLRDHDVARHNVGDREVVIADKVEVARAHQSQQLAPDLACMQRKQFKNNYFAGM